MAKRTPIVHDDVVEVPLTRGLSAWVDLDDLDLVVGPLWQAQPAKHTFYATRRRPGPRTVHRDFMHRVILGLGPDDADIDHADGNGLNNRRSNLRPATDSQNQANRLHLPDGASSPYRGVFLTPAGTWRARIRVGGKLCNIGSHATEEAAARAYDAAASREWGEFARLNFPEGYDPLGTLM